MSMITRSNLESFANHATIRSGLPPRCAFLALLGVLASATGCTVSTDGGEVTAETQAPMLAATITLGFPPPRVDQLVEIGAGGGHTCVRRSFGRVWCWGRSDSGQAGGTPVPISPFGGGYGGIAQPTLVANVTAAHLAIGFDHSCALTSTGQALCWGNNQYGALGQNSGAAPGTPTPVGNYNGAPLTFSSLSAGKQATCGVGVQAGASHVYCWGELSYNYAMTFASPKPLLTISGYTFDYDTSVVTGHLGGCVIQAPAVGCWDSVSSTGVSNVQISGWNTSTGHVSTANNFTCADQANGTVECFGMDNLGQLGDGVQGGSSFHYSPQAVGGGMQLHGVSAGDRHACALDSSDNIVCWGANEYGQLGNGTVATLQAATAPTAINAPAGVHFRAVAAGENHTCAIGTNDHVYCWGSNFYFQIGAGSLTDQNNNFANPTQAIDPT